jgi:hypothetical protein
VQAQGHRRAWVERRTHPARHADCHGTSREVSMLYLLWALAGVLVLLWLLGIAGTFAAGGWIHLFLLLAVVAVAASLFSRPRTV